MIKRENKKQKNRVGFLSLLSKFEPHPGEQPQTNQAQNKQRTSIHINRPSSHKTVSTKKNKKQITSPNIEIGGRDGKVWTRTPRIEKSEAARKPYLSFVDRGGGLFQNFLEISTPAFLSFLPPFLLSFSPQTPQCSPAGVTCECGGANSFVLEALVL